MIFLFTGAELSQISTNPTGGSRMAAMIAMVVDLYQGANFSCSNIKDKLPFNRS
jgi:hypothetical protein